MDDTPHEGREAPHGGRGRRAERRVRLRAHRPGLHAPARPHPVDAYGTKTPAQPARHDHAPRAAAADRAAVRPEHHERDGAGDHGVGPGPHAEQRRQDHPPAGPQLTEERRKEMVRLVHKMAEEGRVAVRNVRRDVLNELKRTEKDGDLSRDELKRARGRGPEAHRRRGQAHRRPHGPQRGRDPRGLSRPVTLLTRLRTARTVLGLGRAPAPSRAAGADRDPRVRRDHHGRQRALGARAAPARGRRPPGGRAGAEAGGARRVRRGRSRT